jgi:hypothetical protein
LERTPEDPGRLLVAEKQQFKLKNCFLNTTKKDNYHDISYLEVDAKALVLEGGVEPDGNVSSSKSPKSLLERTTEDPARAEKKEMLNNDQ